MNIAAVRKLKDEWVYEKHMREGSVDVVIPPKRDRSRSCVDRVHGRVVGLRRQKDSLMQAENNSR